MLKLLYRYKGISLNLAFLFACLSILLCWFTGIIPFILGFLSLKQTLDFKKMDVSWTETGKFKLRWVFRFSVIGLVFSAFFGLIYFLALIKGAFISWF